ncbi:hypothetical protein WG907_15920 [Sphingobium sp. AN558]|uniref:hypothetical protein n=1 Tax=Sphingobium sp. AN558 TaxID=3133442 RepID=UPI0030BEE645
MLSESTLGDHAVDENVEMAAGDSAPVRFAVTRKAGTKRRFLHAHFSNATSRPVGIEVKIARTDDTPVSPARGLLRKDGDWLWRTTVPANATATLDYDAPAVD